jgi:hypothetical protein
MLPDLKEWESEAPESAPRLVVVSAGSEEANKEMELTSPILLDQNFATGRSFGTSGTPSAVLVDAEGKVASEICDRGRSHSASCAVEVWVEGDPRLSGG